MRNDFNDVVVAEDGQGPRSEGHAEAADVAEAIVEISGGMVGKVACDDGKIVRDAIDELDQALGVAGDELGTEVVITDTRALRMFTTLALDIGWRRIGDHKPGTYAGLRQAVEKAMSDTLGMEAKPIDAETRAKVVELYRGIAWAGMAGG